MPQLLTQRALIAKIREEMGVGVDTPRIHAWIRAGMPTVPGGKKPRFIWSRVHAWLVGTQESDPLTLDVRDRLLARNYKGAM